MGRPRKPNRLKLLQGTDRPGRMYPEVEYVPLGEVPAPPDDLDGPDAVLMWEEIAPQLHAVGIFTAMDKFIVLRLCNLHSAILRLERAHQRVPTSDVQVFSQLLQQLGMTPASRSKVATSGAPKKSSFADVRKTG